MADAAALFERYQWDIYRWLRSKMPTAQPEDIEDLVAETFLRACRSSFTRRDDASPFAWLVTIANRARIDSFRKQHGRQGQRMIFTVPIEEAAELTDHANYSDQVIDRLDIARALEDLPIKHRRAIEAHYLQDMTYADAAQQFGCSGSLVQQHVAAGCERIRQQLEAA